MKVLFVLEYYDPHIGGVETLFKSLAHQLAQNGHEITVVTNRYDSKLKTYESVDGVEVYRYRFYNRYLFTFFAWISGLRHAEDADLIHTTSYNAALPAWIIAKIKKKDVIITFHEYWGKLWFQLPWLNPISRFLNSTFERMLVKLSFKKIIAVSTTLNQPYQMQVSASIDWSASITVSNIQILKISINTMGKERHSIFCSMVE